jgi:hypothetical protein
MNPLNPYLKFIVALLGAAVTSLAVIYPAAHWLPVVTSMVTAVSVYLTPNLPKNGAVPTQPIPAVRKDSQANPFGGAE